MKNVIFTIFGFDVQLWVLISVGFLALYFVFTGLGALKQKKLKAKRQDKINVDHDI